MTKLAADGYDPERLTERALNILASNELCSLATVSSDGEPHINTAYFAFDSAFKLYILTSPKTAHGFNVQRNRAVALTVFDSHQQWGSELRGLQLFGTIRKLSLVSVSHGFKLYVERFPGLQQWVTLPTQIRKALDSRFYEVTVNWLKVFDEPAFGKENFIRAEVVRRG